MLVQIPMSAPDVTGVEVAAVNDVLNTPSLSIGPRLQAFEQAVASYVGVIIELTRNALPPASSVANTISHHHLSKTSMYWRRSISSSME